MRIQPIINQQNFSGKLVIDNSARNDVTNLLKEHKLIPRFKEIAGLVQNKPYDLFLYTKKENPNYFFVAANKTEQQAKDIKEYTVKIQPSILPASIVDAAKDAMEMYEKYISKSIKG